MIGTNLFTRKGPEEPTRNHLGHQRAAYVLGREDFLYRRGYAGNCFPEELDRFTYRCGWDDEAYDMDTLKRGVG